MKLKLKTGPAPLWKRVFAYFVDLAIINFVVAFPFQGIMQKFVSVETDNFSSILNFFKGSPETTKVLFFTSLIMSVLTVLYWAVLEFKIQQSVGKMLLNIHVKSTKKGDLKFSQCLVRNITKISLIPIILDSVYMIFTKQHQRYFERMSNTEVVDKGKLMVK
tara:strand:+ start:58 stop:543 length:486 start_codon:yes stop_codon:yes gene_type:complete